MEQNLVRKFASSGGGKEKFHSSVSYMYAGRLPQKLLRCPRRLPLGLIMDVHSSDADRSLPCCTASTFCFRHFSFSTHAVCKCTTNGFSVRYRERWVPFRPSSPSDSTSARWQLSRQPADQRDGGNETHEGAGAKAAAPPMRARMARTRMVEVDGRKKGMTTRAKQAKQSEAKMAGEA